MDKVIPTTEQLEAMRDACEESLYEDGVREATLEILANYQEVEHEQLLSLLFDLVASAISVTASNISLVLFDNEALRQRIEEANKADEMAIEEELQNIIRDFTE